MRVFQALRSRVLMAAAALLVLGGGVLYAALAPGGAAAPSLTSFAPEGALLVIESPDFAGLLRSWNNSAEQQRWLKSDNYAGFSRSRLFSRLGQAQDEFAGAAGLPTDTAFLQSVAGGHSLFAWYDIGNLEFLYMTRMAPGAAARSPLMQIAGKFQRREAGGTAFYVRTVTGTEGAATRTVAFAVRGDTLLLATREDLLAGALSLMSKPSDATLEHAPWYAAAMAATGKRAPGDLRMALDLARIAKTPQFRTYWVQGNVSETAEYSAAVADLYRAPGAFREERVLLPAAMGEADGDSETAKDLQPVLQYLAPGAGVYRATANPTTEGVLAQLEDKLLSRGPGGFSNSHTAPTADLSTPSAGGPGDYETRIDARPVVLPQAAAAVAPLRSLLEAAHPSAMLVSASGAEWMQGGDPVFAAMHAAVVLTAEKPWDANALKSALAEALGTRLSVGARELPWAASGSGFELGGGMAHLAFLVRGPVCVLASDAATLRAATEAANAGHAAKPLLALSVAGFRQAGERERFLRLARLLDHKPAAAANENAAKPDAPSDAVPAASADASNPDMPSTEEGTTPPFLAGNMASLSQTFRDLAEETVTVTPGDKGAVRQTVVYRWQR